MNAARYRVAPVAALLLIAATATGVTGITGCGSSGGQGLASPNNDTSGKVLFRVAWPQATRVVPPETKQVRVILSRTENASSPSDPVPRVIERPADSTVFSSLRIGKWYVLAQALDAAGKKVAEGRRQVDVAPHQTTQAVVELQRTEPNGGGAGGGTGGTTGGSGVPAGVVLGAVDAPADGEVVRGIKGIAGWALERRDGTGDVRVDKITIIVDDVPVGEAEYPVAREDGNPGFRYQWDASKAASGAHRLTARVTTSDGRSIDFERNFVVDNTGPIGAIDAPLRLSTVQGVQAVVGWAIDKDGPSGVNVDKVEILVEGAPIGEAEYPVARDDGNPGFRFAWDTRTTSNGLRNLSVRITDKLGNQTTIDTQVVVTQDERYVRLAGGASVWRVYQGQRRTVPSRAALEDIGGSVPAASVVSLAELAQYPSGDPVAHVITDDGGDLWLVQYEGRTRPGVRRRFTRWEVYEGMGYSRDDVKVVTHDRLLGYDTRDDISQVEPRLIVTADPTFNGSRIVSGYGAYTVRFRVKNLTRVPVGVSNLLLSMTSADQQVHMDSAGTGPFTIGPGEERDYTGIIDISRSRSTYTYNVAYQTNGGSWLMATPKRDQFDLLRDSYPDPYVADEMEDPYSLLIPPAP
jgi:hypothetical protein